MNRLIIQTQDRHLARKQYAFHVVLRELLDQDFSVEPSDTPGHRLILPNGGVLEMDDRFDVLDSPENAAKPGFWQPVLQASGVSNPLPDYFAAAYYLLNNLDMRSTPTRDSHGRLPVTASVSYQYGFLQRPVIHEWAAILEEAFRQKGWELVRKKREFRLSVSCDVDHPLLWWSKPQRLKTLFGAVVKRNDWGEAAFWLRNYFFKPGDPYDVFEEWMALFERHNLRAQFNFMGERPRSSDCWYPLRHPFVLQLMQKLADRGHSIGFHPSYEAYEAQSIFNRELASLRAVSPLEIKAGRQHYLRFDQPRTWRMWTDAGLTEDSTLGFPEREGFRNGMCQDFPVFDEEKGEITALREKPLIAMDVTLAQYQSYSPEHALEKLEHLKQEVKKYGGDFTLLWHNSSWNTPFWLPWKRVLQQFLNSK